MKTELADFTRVPLKDAARQLLAKLGYNSKRYLVSDGSRPQDFLATFSNRQNFDESKALVSEWISADFLFQLTDKDFSRESVLFTDDSVSRGLLKSYVFIAIELKDAHYARGKFSAIARQINRLLPMPVMVIFKHGDLLTIAVINRRRNKLDENKDVLEKVTLIRDINVTEPHRGHLDILGSLELSKLVHPQKKPITDFDTLHAAWEQIFNIELLNERFYKELSNWYFWALPQVDFPADLEPDAEKRRATGLIRLLTRLIFCWFLKEKGLIPEKLFDTIELEKLLKGFDPESESSSTYYQAILQNLFFATLNQRMGKDSKGSPYRTFATDEGFLKNKSTYDVNNLYRYEKLFAVSPEEALEVFADIPFLNGGLFECLDRTEDGTNKKRYLDGFSRNTKKRPKVPDRLFFDSGETADLSTAYGDNKRKAEKVTGLISILKRYKFTIVENTPIDQEIALDPELLGKVFENLLASYNEETKTTARKQTGSFYTPRPIVDYMVDESLKAHLTRALVEQVNMQEADARAGLDILFTYSEKEHPFTPKQVAALIASIDDVKILDPACGSGAFPMGVLHKLVYVLGKLDPDNERWKQTQLAKLDSASMREELERSFTDNNDDYGRKLYLIENCLYGVDIQPIAIQITKLRFFISLVCDQKENKTRENFGVRSLPNLETKFVAANTLIGLDKQQQTLLRNSDIEERENELKELRHRYFTATTRKEKIALQKQDKQLRLEIGKMLENDGWKTKVARQIVAFDPYDQNQLSPWFDMEWMFGVTTGFDIVIGNPPYGAKFNSTDKLYFQNKYETAKTIKGIQKGSLNTYTLFIELGHSLTKTKGNLHYIVPISITSSDSVTGVHKLLEATCSTIVISSYAVRPEPVFDNATVNTSILYFKKDLIPSQQILSTKMYRKKGQINLKHLVDNLEFIDVSDVKLVGRYPKISLEIEKRILKKILNQNVKIGDCLKPKGKDIYYRFAGGRYFKVVTNYSTGSSAERSITFDKKISNLVGAILSSNLYFWFYQIFSDNLNLKAYEIESFGLPTEKLTDDIIEQVNRIYASYLNDIEQNATVRQTTKYANIDSFKEYKIGKSKHLIDQIDDVIAPLYGLNKEELNFIKNYELQFRLQDDE